MTRRLTEMTWPDVAEAVRAGATTVILPFGATEQHGPHLPLGPDALVAPALPFGCSDEHAGFPGLLGLEAGTLARVILDLARRLAGWGTRRLVLLCAHGGNGEALDLAQELLRQELPGLEVRTNGNLATVAPALLEVARRDGISASALGLHAGDGETSEMLHMLPGLLHPEDSAPVFTGDMAAVLDELREGGLRAVTGNGVPEDPARADAARGARYLGAATEDLAAQLRDAHGDRGGPL